MNNGECYRKHSYSIKTYLCSYLRFNLIFVILGTLSLITKTNF